jgi:DNA topoisomerase-3
VIYGDQKKDKAKPAKGKGKEDEEEEEIEVNEPFSISPTDEVICSDAVVKEKDTQPPKHYTEGTLLKAMESAGKQIEDEELRDAMKDSGLGTPATRAATIERLKNVGYVEMQGKKIAITQKGRTAIELIRGAGIELLTSPEMTGQWERRLNEIARGTAADSQFMENVKRFASMIVDKVKVQSRASKTSFEGETPSIKGGAKGRAGGSAAKASPDKPAAATRRRSGEGGSNSAGKTAAARQPRAAAEAADAGPKIIGACPRPGCGGTIFMGRKGYGCSHYKEGCKFVIWKENHGRTLTDAQVKALIEKGKTGKLKLAGEDGSPLEGKLILSNMDTGQLSVE